MTDPTLCYVQIFREEGKRGKFKTYTFAVNEVLCENDSADFDYLPQVVCDSIFKTKAMKVNSILASHIRIMQQKYQNTKDFLLELLIFFVNPHYSCTTYICQDSDSLMLMTLLKGLVNNGICPNVIRKGRNIMLLEISELSIRFLNSNNYLSGTEYEIANQFGITCDSRIFFPYRFLVPSNFQYTGKIP